MPTLQFKGKNIIWNHHLTIPYHTLEEVTKLDFQAKKGEGTSTLLSAGNLIIEGDNLLALKALLPQYQGKIKCIYIDPPYNTGNEGWIYNDKVNSPLIKEWLGKEVGKEDMTRHDKWLCMMVPRLRLLRDLLDDDGVICISIDDLELGSLLRIMDEIYGEQNKEEVICWRRRHNQPNDKSKAIGKVAEFIVIYAKNLNTLKSKGTFNGLALSGDFSNPDHDPKGDWASKPWKSGSGQTGTKYKIVTPTGKILSEEWLGTEDTFKAYLAEGRIYWPKNGDGLPRKKYYKFEREIEGQCAHNFWGHEEFGSNQEASDEIASLKIEFDNPKPTKLIKSLLQIFTIKDSIILDSFAGSGTTMHALFDLNKDIGSKRKCIMVQMTEASKQEPDKNICKDITRERVKRAIEKYEYESGFKYLRVGDPIDPESLLSGVLPTYKQFAKYVYYLCTGEYLKDESKIDEKTYFVGLHKQQAIYLVYKKDYDELTRLALNLPLAESILKARKGKKCIVYAPACFLDEDYLQEKNIDFVGIPYNLFRRNSQ
ncbi:site-specific DNA-methyltransferase [candidate division TA06 bacterium]|uniref:Site-specific DNA-methyltransferase n=1 Tax=candidate division TA06 bacterium TaxID=2250710 RepID=A0A933I6U1_UNCT6|nr:site-specific DNA-methyltransferase [candidate division TA06 bacterium]